MATDITICHHVSEKKISKFGSFQDNLIYKDMFGKYSVLQAAFSDKVCIDEARLYMGEWAAAFGRQEANHSGEFMGIAPTGKRVEIRYMDFWKVVDGKIVDNYVSVDFPHVMAQLGKDAFDGNGWEVYDRGERVPPAPKTE